MRTRFLSKSKLHLASPQNLVLSTERQRRASLLPLPERPPRRSGFRWHACAETRRSAGAARLVRRSGIFVLDLACSTVRQVCASPREGPTQATSLTSAPTCPDAPSIVSFVPIADGLIGSGRFSGRAFSGILWLPQIWRRGRRIQPPPARLNSSTRHRPSTST